MFLDQLTTPPLEDHLSRYTLSPELEKLYAHPSEIIAIATSHSGDFIASTCKSTTPENAVIRVFNTTHYTEIAVLKSHSLTVTKLAWSEDDEMLVSVGRDRQWSLFDTKGWKLVKSVPRAHARIIWDVSFSPAAFGCVFVTASRDKTSKFWGGETWDCIATLKFSEAVTSCSFLPEVVRGRGIVAIGLENGRIYIIGCEVGRTEWRVVKEVEGMTHSDAVTGLAWRPCSSEGGTRELASCGDDCSVRIYEIAIDTSGASDSAS